jgi:hypothetical protein
MSELIQDIHLDPIEWKKVEEKLKQRFGKTPDLHTIVYLIGHRELGLPRTDFSKEEKQDLMHVGVCTLLSKAGYYQFSERDADGWPHFRRVPGMPRLTGDMQDMLLKAMIIEYFKNL